MTTSFLKCVKCSKKKSSRICNAQDHKMICSLCCGQTRSWEKCNTVCSHFPEEKLNYNPENEQQTELTCLANGETFKFEVPLFLPNILMQIDCNVTKLEILILDFNRVRINFKFKLSAIREIGNEVYNKDSWKIKKSNVPIKNGKALTPLLLISTYESGNSSLEKKYYKYGNAKIESFKTSYSSEVWLPNAKSFIEKVSVKDKPEFESEFIYAISDEGKMSFKKRDVYWGELNTELEYEFSLITSYSKLGIKEDGKIVIPFGFFLPYRQVSFSEILISKPSDFEISDDSFLTIVSSKQEKVTRLFLTPIKENLANVHHGGFNKYFLKDITTPYHYFTENELLYTDYFMFLNPKIAQLFFSMNYYSDYIISAYFNLFDELYKEQYSPINIVVANTTNDIKKIKIEYEIKGLTDKHIINKHIEPQRTTSIPLFPKIDEKILYTITEHTNVTFDVKVYQSGLCLFEETKTMNLLPKETFIYDTEDEGKATKIYFYPLLARWVTPNADAIEQVINKSLQKVESISGDSSNDIKQVKKEISAIYDTLAENIKYVSRTFSLYKDSTTLHQKIYLPENTYKNASGNCIDLTVLLASCLEKINYNPLLIIVPGHAFLGVKLDKESIYIETTCIGYDTFENAIKFGQEEYEKYFLNNKTKQGHVIVDIESSRENQIYPMN